MEKLSNRCKGSVHLTVNGHTSQYMSIDSYVNFLNETREAEISFELKDRMINSNCIHELQFYPDTPIGFYTVYGTSLDEVVEKAWNIFS